MKSAILTFPPHSGTSDQTITGVLDQDGNAFPASEMKLAVFVSGFVGANFLATRDEGNNCYDENHGAQMIASGKAACSATADVEKSGAKVSSGCAGGQYPLCELQADNFLGGTVERTAKITAVADGEFTLSYGSNARNGDDVIVVILGGDDLNIDIPPSNNILHASTSYTTTAAPQGVFFMQLGSGLATTGSVSTGAGGGGGYGWGWATRAGAYGGTHVLAANGAGNGRYQRTDQVGLSIDSGDFSAGDGTTIATWGDTSYTTGAVDPVAPMVPFAFSGTGIQAAAGAITSPASVGQQVVVAGLEAKWLVLMSVGAAGSSDVNTTQAELSIGFANAASQVSYWTAEASSTVPLTGCRYLSTDTLGRTATANGASTTFSSVVELASISPAGTFTLDWTTNDGTPRQWLWFALGSAATTPTTTTYVLRRQRRFLLPTEQQYRLFLSRLEILMQTGVGLQTGQGSDPVILLRLSKDGGFTWGNEIQMGIGSIGQYTKRVFTTRLGMGRQWVAEITCSDPVWLAMLECYVDGEKGRN